MGDVYTENLIVVTHVYLLTGRVANASRRIGGKFEFSLTAEKGNSRYSPTLTCARWEKATGGIKQAELAAASFILFPFFLGANDNSGASGN